MSFYKYYCEVCHLLNSTNDDCIIINQQRQNTTALHTDVADTLLYTNLQ